MPPSVSTDATLVTNTTATGDRRTIVTQSEAVLTAGDFGGKHIGYFGGFCLLVNNVTGPGLVEMPGANVSGGWLLVTLVVFGCYILSCLSCTMMLEAMKRMPGNSKFTQRIEFTTLAKYHFVGPQRKWYLVTLILFLLSFLTTLIASVIESAQTMDKALIEIFDKSCAFQLHNTTGHDVHGPGSFGFVCTSDDSASGDSPYGNDAYVVSMGFLVVAVLAVPLGYFNLDDNIWVQILAFTALSFIVVEWSIQAFITGIDMGKHPGKVPAFGTDFSVLGAVLFNFAFVTATPSWCNEKKVGVPIQKSVWCSAGLGTIMFLACGIFPAGAWDCSGNGDLLSVLTNLSTPGVSVLTRALAYSFPAVALVTSIPIFSIIVRYNLIENNICGTFWANMWATVFPWAASIALYAGNGLTIIVNWAGLVTIVPLNFVLPAYFYIKAITADDEVDDDLEQNTALLPDIPPAINNELFQVGDEVDVWVPGHAWIGAFIKQTLHGTADDQVYTVSPADEKSLQATTIDVSPSNIRHKQAIMNHTGTYINGEVEEATVEKHDVPINPVEAVCNSSCFCFTAAAV
ncbi:hypothetical protein DIPPA_05178 [Diplonema papillatum]|nr:hypothetical protein DIPPA_05178 [Diplonema papillatum]